MPALVPPYTIEMLDEMPQEPGVRYELLDGFLIVTPAPAPFHAIVVGRLIQWLRNAVPEEVAICAPPGEIRYGNRTSLQPDILVYPASLGGPDSWQDVTAWWLAIEVASPSSRFYDREQKRVAYLALGVPEYWVVDREAQTIEVWGQGDFRPRTISDRIVWIAPSGHRVVIEAAALFKEVGK